MIRVIVQINEKHNFKWEFPAIYCSSLVDFWQSRMGFSTKREGRTIMMMMRKACDNK